MLGLVLPSTITICHTEAVIRQRIIKCPPFDLSLRVTGPSFMLSLRLGVSQLIFFPTSISRTLKHIVKGYLAIAHPPSLFRWYFSFLALHCLKFHISALPLYCPPSETPTHLLPQFKKNSPSLSNSLLLRFSILFSRAHNAHIVTVSNLSFSCHTGNWTIVEDKFHHPPLSPPLFKFHAHTCCLFRYLVLFVANYISFAD